jgi:hypothetical protein
LQGLCADAGSLELELHQEGVHVLCDGSVFVLSLNFSANFQTFSVTVSFSNNGFENFFFDVRADVSLFTSTSFCCFGISDWLDNLRDFVFHRELVFAIQSLVFCNLQLFLFQLFFSWFGWFNSFLGLVFLGRTFLSLLSAKHIRSLSNLLKFTLTSQ